MKKIIVLILFIFPGVLLYAQKDTTFVLQSEATKSGVKIIIPDSVCNIQASWEDNGRAWYYKKIIPIQRLNTEKEQYNGLYRVTTTTNRALAFNKSTGRNEIVIQNIKKSPRTSALPVLISILIICFVTTTFFQKIAKTENFKAFIDSLFILPILAVCFLCLSRNSSYSLLTAITFSILFISSRVSWHFVDKHSRYKKKLLWRNVFMGLSFILSGFVFALCLKNIPAFIAYTMGLLLGLPTYYFLRYPESKKKKGGSEKEIREIAKQVEPLFP